MTSTTGNTYLGELETVILATLVHLLDQGEEAYGMSLRTTIEERTGRDVSIGTIYAILRRLEAKGYVASELGEKTPERGGRAKRLFRLEPAGAQALDRTRTLMLSVLQELPELRG